MGANQNSALIVGQEIWEIEYFSVQNQLIVNALQANIHKACRAT